MFVLQFCNTFTKEVLRHFDFDSPEEIHMLIRNLYNPASYGFYFLDYEFRLYGADFINYRIIKKTNQTIYKFFFDVKLCDKQPSLKE